MLMPRKVQPYVLPSHLPASLALGRNVIGVHAILPRALTAHGIAGRQFIATLECLDEDLADHVLCARPAEADQLFLPTRKRLLHLRLATHRDKAQSRGPEPCP